MLSRVSVVPWYSCLIELTLVVALDLTSEVACELSAELASELASELACELVFLPMLL